MSDKREPLKGGITRITFGASGEVRYEARWSWINAAGRRESRKSRHKTLKAAQVHRAKMVAALAEGRDASPSKLTVNEYAETWFARRNRDWSTSTAYQRRHQYANHLAPRIGGLRLSQVTRARCQAVVDELAGELSPATVRNTMAIVTGLMRSAMQDGHIAANPASRLELPTVRAQEHVIWTPDQEARFLDHTRNHPHWPLYVLLLSTGMRVGEAIALTWDRVDLDRGRIDVRATLRRTETGNMEPDPGAKTESSRRTIPLTPAVVTMLRGMDQTTRYVIVGPTGDHLTYTEVSRHLRANQQGLGDDWPVISAHGMRHICATRLMRSGVSPVVVKDLLGHANIAITLDTYSHPDLTDLAAAMTLVSTALDGTIGATTSVDETA